MDNSVPNTNLNRANQLIDGAFKGDPNVKAAVVVNDRVDTLESLAKGDGSHIDSVIRDGIDTIIFDTERSDAIRLGQENLIEEGALINPQLWEILGYNHEQVNFIDVRGDDRAEVEAVFNIKFMALLDDSAESHKPQTEPVEPKRSPEQAQSPAKKRSDD